MDEKIQSIFNHRGLLAWWGTLQQAYDEMGFCDALTDSQRIAEYSNIVRKFNNLVNKIETAFYSHYPYDMEKAMNAFVIEDKTKLDTREALVYARLRETWINAARQNIQILIVARQEEEDRSIDGPDTIEF